VGNIFDEIGEIAGMWICDECDTIAYVSVEADTINVTQCQCVQLFRTPESN
jgi:hypothetical protein